MEIKSFFAGAFDDMKKSAQAQHEVDKANFEAVKTESKANFEEAKCDPKAQEAKRQLERNDQIIAAKQRTSEAQERINIANKSRGK